MITSISNKPDQPERNFIKNKYLPGPFMACPGLPHVSA